MHSSFIRHLILSLPLFTSILGQAQSQDSTKQSSKIHLNLGVIANSALNYYGRTDSLKSRAVCPFIGINLNNGLYLNATAVFINNAIQSEYAATLVEAGYNFSNKHHTWSGNLAISKFCYKPDIDLVQSTIRYMGAASITNSNKIINLTLTANVKYSDQPDYGAQTSADHIVIIRKSTQNSKGIKELVLLIDPTISAYGGTQNFTRTFYQQNHFLGIPTSGQTITQNSSRFTALAYEGSIPIILATHNLAIVISPGYILPQHSASQETSTSTSNLFYCTATVKYTLF